MKIAEQVAKKIGLKLNRIDNLNDLNKPYATLSGMFNENAELYANPCDPDYIYKIIQHGYDSKHKYSNSITIFMDDDYLQFKPTTLFKDIMVLLLNDLIFIPFISGASMFRHFKKGATLYPNYKDNVVKGLTIINNWGEHNIQELFK